MQEIMSSSEQSLLTPSKALLTHTDLDGIGSIVLSLYYNLDFSNAYTFNYGDSAIISTVEKHTSIIITDFSLKEEDFVRFHNDSRYNILTFDHHVSSDYLNKFHGNMSDTTRCGTRLFYEEYIIKTLGLEPSKECAMFVELVDVFDRWQTDSLLFEKACDLNRLFLEVSKFSDPHYELMGELTFECLREMLPMLATVDTRFYPFIWRMYMHMKIAKNPICYSLDEKAIIDKANKEENDLISACNSKLSKRADSRNVKFGIYPGARNTSIVSHKLLQMNPDIKYVIAVWDSGLLSARSTPDFDLTELVYLSGHKQAAGGKISSPEVIYSLLNVPTYSFPYKSDVLVE